MHRTPVQIQRFLDEQSYRMDLPAQFLGDEPNAVRKPWDATAVRWCVMASWPYEQAAGNQSIPAVYRCINDGRADFLCDRFYLPATPRDLRLMEKNAIPVFGIETKHQLVDFDVVGTSISYPVLSLSFVKLLTMSGIPLRWREREAAGPEHFPMVIVGGLSYGAPECLAPVVDCWWLGEVEDEPDNPGIAAVTARIADFKAEGRWDSDRVSCYRDLARQFRFLYFPRFVDVHYDYEDRSHVGVGPHPSKQVVGYSSNLEGMRLPFVKRHVKNLDSVAPLDNPPLLYADPAMGSGDLEVGRGCPAWCSFCSLCLSGQTELITRAGPRRLDSVAGTTVEVWTARGWQWAEVAQYGNAPVNRITFAPADFGGFGTADTCLYGHPRTGQIETGGTQSGRTAKLTMELADEIRARHAAGGISRSALACEYGVSQPQVSLLLRGLAWTPNKPKPATSDGNCRTCRRVKAANAYYRKTGRPELVQPLVRIEGWRRERGWRQLPRPSLTVDHEATVSHRWPLVDGTETHHLKVGDFVRAEYVSQVDDLEEVERGFIHGFVFGDGSEARTTSKGRVFSVGLYGDKDAAHAKRFARYLRDDLKYQRDPVTGVAVLRLGPATPVGPNGVMRSEVRLVTDVSMKDFPSVGATPDYVRGFVEGWLAADGSASDGRQSIHLDSQHPGARVWLERTAVFAGWVLVGDVESPIMNTNLMRRKAPLHRFTLTRACGWKVVSVQEGVESQPVYCATVPGEGFFALASGVYTGNTYRAKPYRQRSVPYMVEYAKRMQANMGSVRMAPFSPDFPMHTQRKALIAALLENVSDEVDAPTMRVDDFIADDQFILLQVHGGMDTVTLGVEGNSQRMRDLVGKGTADEDIKEAVTRGIRAGIRKFKLYMINNLPGEDEGDIVRIVKLAKELADIRESMNQPTVRIQFSWTPLLIEGNTPFQWFSPPPASRILGDVCEELRDLKIEFKIGAKGEPNKFAFFQLCQRASRDIGEALVDAMQAVDQACWGGVPRTFKDLLEDKLHQHGFANGFADAFDERFKADMFGWEFIDQGVSAELMWITYLQMREFVEQTDSHTYDENFDSSYHGNEWIQRCDSRCYGKTCGTCDHTDLKIRTGYLKAAKLERHIDLSTVKLVDQRSQAIRVRARLFKPERYRFVGNDHWRFSIRRAAFRAQDTLGLAQGIAKRSIRFASDEVKHKDWTCGVDYVEFAMTRPMTLAQIQTFLDAVNVELEEWMHIDRWILHPANATTMRADIDTALYELELDAEPSAVLTKLHAWHEAKDVPMNLKVEGGYFAPASEQVNAKDYVDDLWLVKDGFRLKLRMLVRGRPSPYNVYAALMGRSSWLDAARLAAVRLEAFVEADRQQQDFLRPNCVDCALLIPTNILDEPYDNQRCPRCRDINDGVAVIG